jgi:malate synthase
LEDGASAAEKSPVDGLEILAPLSEEYAKILTPEALGLLAELIRKFSETREELLDRRVQRQREIDAGRMPGFLAETERIRESEWTIAPEPADLQERHVEITGPAGDRKMVINALNSGADIYMADFEDSQSPTWDATIQGQINLRDATDGTISYSSPEGRQYKPNPKTAVLIVRPRGWHLLEEHVLVDGQPVSASIFDFCLYLSHNAKKLMSKKTGPYFYLPKMESRLEARLWNDIFSYSEEKLGIPKGTIRATALIETILAGFEMEEILFELKDHSAGLNCGRWDYIFSFIKKFRNRSDMVLPDRAQVTMDKAFLGAYVNLSIRTCHRRNAHSIGGMSAYIPVRDEKANQIAMEGVRADKEREVRAGHDGTWVAHPGLVPLAKQIFSSIGGPHQIANKRDDALVSAADLVRIPEGDVTEGGVRTNISVGIQYLEAWLRGKGSVPLNNMMEDAATSEICRAQLWQWSRHGTNLKDGRTMTSLLFRELMKQELQRIESQVGEEGFATGQFKLAAALFEKMVTSREFPEFLTLAAYEELLRLEKNEGHPLKP